MPLLPHDRTARITTLAALAVASLAPVLPVAAAAPATLEARVQLADDIRAIERVLLEYGRTLDARDFKAYAALFANDGVWTGAMGSYRTPATIQKEMERIFAAATDVPKGKNFHVMSNFIIDVQGDRATASSMFVFYQMDGNKPNATVAGRYEDTLVREAGAWRFLERKALPPGTP